MAGAIDAFAAAPLPDLLAMWNSAIFNAFAPDDRTEADVVRRLDEAGVDMVALPAVRTSGARIPAAAVRGMINRHPDRFFGIIGIDRFDTKTSIREILAAVELFGFKALHLYPHHLQAPANDSRYDPFYRLAGDLGVPVLVTTGFSFDAAKGPPTLADVEAIQRHDLTAIQHKLSEIDHPRTLQMACRRWPNVNFVATHCGWPWTDELVTLAESLSNLFITTSMHYPSTWDTSLVQFIRGAGQGKVLWSTNAPEVPWHQALAEIRALNLPAAVQSRLVRDNAVDLFRLTTGPVRLFG